jgi:precorrin-4 methylase
MTRSARESIWGPLARLSSWLKRTRLGYSSFDLAGKLGEHNASSQDMTNYLPRGDQYPPLQEGANFLRNVRSGTPLPIQLSIHTLDNVVRELVPFFGENCPISVIYNKSPAQVVHPAEVVQATLSTIQNVSDYSPHARSAFILVG